jgi:hypothetical protein
MHIIFFILSLVMFYYSGDEPQCIYGGVIFLILGLLLITTEIPRKKASGLRKKNKF